MSSILGYWLINANHPPGTARYWGDEVGDPGDVCDGTSDVGDGWCASRRGRRETPAPRCPPYPAWPPLPPGRTHVTVACWQPDLMLHGTIEAAVAHRPPGWRRGAGCGRELGARGRGHP